MKHPPILLAVLVLAGCSDSVTERYATVEDARTAGLFERGWLPAVIPSSAHDIEANNDLDLNTSAGGFSLSKSDLDSFTSRLQPYSAEAVNADVHLAAYLEAKKNEGQRAGVLRETPSIWAFACDAQTNRCVYQLASER